MSSLLFALAAPVLVLTGIAFPTGAMIPHDPGLSSLQLRQEAGALVGHVAFANADFRGAVSLDADGDRHLDAAELARGSDALRELVREQFLLGPDGGAAGAEFVRATLAENDDVELTMRWPLPAAGELAVPFLDRLTRGHRCYAALLDEGDAIVVDALLRPGAHRFLLPAAGGTATASGFGQSWRFVALGIEHILIGFDHLAFLLALLIAGTTWRRVLATITAFTVAHSITLAAAALGVVTLPSLLVEATIAGSIVVTALANLWQRSGAVHRWPLAFGFGLVHGFGFASVLAGLDIGGAHPLLPLFSFNLGVEVGQLAFACVVVPLLARAARGPHGRRWTNMLSIAVGLAGCWWLCERLLA